MNRPLTVYITPVRDKRTRKYKLREIVVFNEMVPTGQYPYRALKKRQRLWKPAKLPNGRGREFDSPKEAIDFYLEVTK